MWWQLIRRTTAAHEQHYSPPGAPHARAGSAGEAALRSQPLLLEEPAQATNASQAMSTRARETLAFGDYSPHASWAVGGGAHGFDEEASDIEARSARLAAADVVASAGGTPGAAAPLPMRMVTTRGTARFERAAEQLVLEGEAFGATLTSALTPARRGAPHALIFTPLNIVVCTLILFWHGPFLFVCLQCDASRR